MFVLLAIPIVGGFIAGRFLRSERVAMVWAGGLWLVASGLMIAERASDPRNGAIDTRNEFNVTFWIGVAVGLIVGLASARFGNWTRHVRG